MDTLPPPFAVGRTAEIYAWQAGTILKLYRDWCPSNWVEHEAHIAEVVTQVGLPAPRAFGIVELNGRRGLVYERLDGDSMLKVMLRQPLKLPWYGRMLADLHLEMHRHSGTGLPEQRGQLERSITTAKSLPDDLRARALQALARLPDGDRSCHGDFHPENVLMNARGPVIIDWMTASRGNPLAPSPLHRNVIINSRRQRLPSVEVSGHRLDDRHQAHVVFEGWNLQFAHLLGIIRVQ